MYIMLFSYIYTLTAYKDCTTYIYACTNIHFLVFDDARRSLHTVYIYMLFLMNIHRLCNL